MHLTEYAQHASLELRPVPTAPWVYRTTLKLPFVKTIRSGLYDYYLRHSKLVSQAPYHYV